MGIFSGIKNLFTGSESRRRDRDLMNERVAIQKAAEKRQLNQMAAQKMAEDTRIDNESAARDREDDALKAAQNLALRARGVNVDEEERRRFGGGTNTGGIIT